MKPDNSKYDAPKPEPAYLPVWFPPNWTLSSPRWKTYWFPGTGPGIPEPVDDPHGDLSALWVDLGGEA